MRNGSITPSITVDIGGQLRIYHAFVTTAPPALDGPATMTLHTSTFSDVAAPPETPVPVQRLILPTPAQPATPALRMPSIEDFPALGQKVFRARRGELPEGDHPEQRQLTLLQRLAAVALGRQEDEQEPQQTPKARPNSS